MTRWCSICRRELSVDERRKTCEPCRIKARESSNASRLERIRLWICVACGSEPAREGVQTCAACHIRACARVKEWKAKRVPLYEYRGQMLPISQIAKLSKRTPNLLRSRLAKGWSIEDAATMPPLSRSAAGRRAAQKIESRAGMGDKTLPPLGYGAPR
jgi:hypothetical protein